MDKTAARGFDRAIAMTARYAKYAAATILTVGYAWNDRRNGSRSLVEEALRGIPRRFRDAMKNVAVVVEDEPSQELLDELEMEPDDTLFGLYHGTPLTERESNYGNALPDRISIYQLPIEEACEDEEDIR